MSAVMQFIVGFIAALSFVLVFSCIDGLIGERAILFIGAVAGMLFIAALNVNGAGRMSAELAPLAYWVGFVVGSLVSVPAAGSMAERMKIGGTPLLVYYARGVLRG